MKTPKESKMTCPFGCDAKVKLVTEHRKFISKGNLHYGDFWVYKCEKCEEGFTTTESDTISMKNLKVKRL